METRVSSPKNEVIIGENQPTVLIGERINPAGKKKLAEALKGGDLEIVRSEALAQVQAGADILDVNVGTFGVDEVSVLPRAVRAVMEVAVIGIPDPYWVEKVHAVVATKKGTSTTADELVTFCKKHIAGYKVPKTVEFMDSLPKYATSKILKKELRDKYWKK